jgi:hypothetical protein
VCQLSFIYQESNTGKGDLTIIRENPLKKIETCRKAQIVVKNGEIYNIDKIAFSAWTCCFITSYGALSYF